MIDRGFPVFVFAPPGPTLKGTRELLEKVQGLGAETIVISSEPSALKSASRQIRIPERAAELLSPIPYIIPAQIFAALLAEAKGLTPDQPRSLSKVTKTV
jgi:glutamine---fructose-6-phosphate transaminase (isomerizing)